MLLLGVVLEEAGAALFLIHADVGVEVFAFLVDHVLEVEGASRVKSLALLLGQLKSTELTGSALALPWGERLFLSLAETLAVTEDELDALLIGIDLKRSVEGLAVLGGHALYFDRLTFDEVLVLLVREHHPFDLLGDGYSVST